MISATTQIRAAATTENEQWRLDHSCRIATMEAEIRMLKWGLFGLFIVMLMFIIKWGLMCLA